MGSYLFTRPIGFLIFCSLGPDVSISFITIVFRTYLLDQSMEHLSATLKRGGVKDLLGFFPENKRSAKNLDAHFKSAGLPQVAEWYAKKQSAVAKEGIMLKVKEMCEAEDSIEDVCSCALIIVLPSFLLMNRLLFCVDYYCRAGTAGRAGSSGL